MSQAGRFGSGGGGTSITQLDGDTGTASGATVNVITGYLTGPMTNGTSQFTGDNVSTLTLSFSDSASNTGIGTSSLASLTIFSASANTALGFVSGVNIVNGNDNTLIGTFAGAQITDGDNNCGLGANVLNQLVTGNNNIAIGSLAATNYTGAESSNIILSNAGTLGESNTIRIGTQGAGLGQQNTAFMAGVYNVTPGISSPLPVYIDSSGQLGTASAVGIYAYTNVNTSPYVVLSTDEFLGVDCSVIPIIIELPNAPVVGRSWTIKDRTGSAAINNITVTTVGGVVLIDGTASYTILTAYEALSFLFDGTSYQIY